jgi:hypothetical protein
MTVFETLEVEVPYQRTSPVCCSFDSNISFCTFDIWYEREEIHQVATNNNTPGAAGEVKSRLAIPDPSKMYSTRDGPY